MAQDPKLEKLIQTMRRNNIGEFSRDAEPKAEIRSLKDQISNLQNTVNTMKTIMIVFGAVFGLSALFTLIWWIKYAVMVAKVGSMF